MQTLFCSIPNLNTTTNYNNGITVNEKQILNIFQFKLKSKAVWYLHPFSLKTTHTHISIYLKTSKNINISHELFLNIKRLIPLYKVTFSDV